MPVEPTAKEFVNASDAPAANTAAVATIAANANAAYRGLRVSWSYAGAGTLAGGNLLVKKGTTTIVNLDISDKKVDSIDIDGWVTAKNELLSATLAAGGANVTGKVNISAKIIDP